MCYIQFILNKIIHISELGIDLQDQPALEMILSKVRDDNQQFLQNLKMQKQNQDNWFAE